MTKADPNITSQKRVHQFAKFLAIGGHRLLTRRTQGAQPTTASNTAVSESTRNDPTPETMQHRVGIAVSPPEPGPKVGDDCEEPVSSAQAGDSHKPYIQQGP